MSLLGSNSPHRALKHCSMSLAEEYESGKYSRTGDEQSANFRITLGGNACSFSKLLTDGSTETTKYKQFAVNWDFHAMCDLPALGWVGRMRLLTFYDLDTLSKLRGLFMMQVQLTTIGALFVACNRFQSILVKLGLKSSSKELTHVIVMHTTHVYNIKWPDCTWFQTHVADTVPGTSAFAIQKLADWPHTAGESHSKLRAKLKAAFHVETNLQLIGLYAILQAHLFKCLLLTPDEPLMIALSGTSFDAAAIPLANE